MREFYRQLTTGADIGDAMRRAKLKMLEQFGPEAVPKLWSGVLVNGDSADIEFEDGQTPTTGYLMSSWLEKR